MYTLCTIAKIVLAVAVPLGVLARTSCKPPHNS